MTRTFTVQPREIPFEHQLMDTLGHSEWEWLAAILVKAAHEAQQWVPLTENDLRFRPPAMNGETPREALRSMTKEGYLEETPRGYMLTDTALRLLKNPGSYPKPSVHFFKN